MNIEIPISTKSLSEQLVQYESSNISFDHYVELFIQIANSDNNLLTITDLRKMFVDQLIESTGINTTIEKNLQSISSARKNTEDAIDAIEKKDDNKLKVAYAELKKSESEMYKLEDEVYTDILTNLRNYRYLQKYKLDTNGNFTSEGSCFYIMIEDIEVMQKSYSSKVVQVVFKHFTNQLKKVLNKNKNDIIRYNINEFLILSPKLLEGNIKRELDALQTMYSQKKFKILEENVIQYNFTYSVNDYSIGDSLNTLLSQLKEST